MPDRPSPSAARRAWLIAPLSLAAALAGGWIGLRHPAWLFGAVATVVVGAAVLWVVVSAFSPSKAERTCPRCGSEALERMDRASTRGVRCGACGFEDPTVSSFYMAEEEGPLEPLVLAGRRRTRQGESDESGAAMSHTAPRGSRSPGTHRAR